MMQTGAMAIVLNTDDPVDNELLAELRADATDRVRRQCAPTAGRGCRSFDRLPRLM